MELVEIYKMARDGQDGDADRQLVSAQRASYGVAVTDTWCLHDYIGQTLANGLQILRTEGHGWPSGEEYPNPEDWDLALADIIMRLRQASTRDEQHDKVYDEIPWSPEDEILTDVEELQEWLNKPSTPEFQEYSRRCTEIDNLAQENIEFVMNWLFKWWFALWD